MAFIGLEAEEYDRQYEDSYLFKRIKSYFSPHRRELGIVVLFLILGSLSYALVPVLITLAINNLETTRDFSYILLLLVLILILDSVKYSCSNTDLFTLFTIITSF